MNRTKYWCSSVIEQAENKKRWACARVCVCLVGVYWGSQTGRGSGAAQGSRRSLGRVAVTLSGRFPKSIFGVNRNLSDFLFFSLSSCWLFNSHLQFQSHRKTVEGDQERDTNTSSSSYRLSNPVKTSQQKETEKFLLHSFKLLAMQAVLQMSSGLCFGNWNLQVIQGAGEFVLHVHEWL